MSTLSENLKYLRIIANKNVGEISSQVGCSFNTLLNWEKGKISPPADAVEKLCHIYKVTPSEIFGWDKCSRIEAFKETSQNILIKIESLESQKAKIEKELSEQKKNLSHFRGFYADKTLNTEDEPQT